MEKVHARLNNSEGQFGWTAENLVASLNKFNVPKKEQDELVAIVFSLKDRIVGQLLYGRVSASLQELDVR